ncbi:hypothetical protein [Litoreibacter roseus]|uniref:DUF4148 domain-containing protein n=1 Tax=Litoreibacter roseus TaxID=2601869 RepID=A0A6N6JBR1_9RHOB|nr:hypothetical protein [Litoreibacter roseus]GFE63504.1 hypothetical protein KIN_05780 [Litoreibacter roseus]
MKTFIATAAIAVSLSAPAFAQVTDAQSYFAQFNDSAAEQIVRAPAQIPTRGVGPDFVAATERLEHEDSIDGRYFFGGNVETNTSGKAQIAASLGVDADNYSLAELINLRNSLEDDDS